MKHKREDEWCRCGHRRIFAMHTSRFTMWLNRTKIWWGDVPPHKFERETSMMRVQELEAREKREMDEMREKYDW